MSVADLKRRIERLELLVLGKKKCSKCFVVKSTDDFFKNKSTRDGYSGQCKTCHTEKMKEINSNKPKVRKQNLMQAVSSAKGFDSLPDSARIKSTVVLAVLGVESLSTLWRWEKSGRMPPSHKVAGSRYKSWSVGEIRNFIKTEIGGG